MQWSIALCASASSPDLGSVHSDLLNQTDRCIAFDYTVVNSYTLLVKDIVYSRSTVRVLARMPRKHADRIRNKIQAYARNPASQANNIARLQARDNLLRLRVGDWRVVMHDADALEILHIARRGSVLRSECMTDTVTITKAEYERLCALQEDLADIQAALTVQAKIAAGSEELVPAEVADRIIDGDPPLRVWREYRDLTQSALARASKTSRIQIVDIEAGRATGSVQTLRRLADALQVSVDDIVPA